MTVLLQLAVSSAALAAPPVIVSGAWARATAPGQDSGVVYLTLQASVADSLVGVSSPDSQSAMLHRTTQHGGMSGMADMGALSLAAGGTARLAPHGDHIMLMGLRHALAAGGSVAVELDFAKAGAMHIQVPVQPIGAAGPPK